MSREIPEFLNLPSESADFIIGELKSGQDDSAERAIPDSCRQFVPKLTMASTPNEKGEGRVQRLGSRGAPFSLICRQAGLGSHRDRPVCFLTDSHRGRCLVRELDGNPLILRLRLRERLVRRLGVFLTPAFGFLKKFP